MTDAYAPFPLDWNQWRAQWDAWRATSGLYRARKNPWAAKGKNFLADDVLGVYRTPDGRTVELSEVTFPNLTDRDPKTGILLRDEYRYVGLTFENGETDLVRTFDELARALGWVHPSQVTVSGPDQVTGIRGDA